jgi:hypothetical protein
MNEIQEKPYKETNGILMLFDNNKSMRREGMGRERKGTGGKGLRFWSHCAKNVQIFGFSTPLRY